MKISAFVCVALMVGGAAAAKTSAIHAASAAGASRADSAFSRAPGGHAANESATPAAQPSYGKLAEVVVTAEKRVTPLQQTPISATVMTGSQLLHAGVINVNQLETISPSLAVNNFGQGNDFNIRGIGKGEHNTQTVTGVVTYRDGVASFPGYFQDEPFYDLSSIEVLRGPQGTFAGENAIGGAVYITEAPPNFSGVHGYVTLQHGNYNDTMVQGAVNIPMTHTLASRVAFYGERRNSFFHITGPYSGGNGALKEGALRYSLMWRPSQSLNAIWRTDYVYVDNGGYPASPATAKTDLFHISASGTQLGIDQFGRSTLNVNYTMPSGITLRSISGVQWGRTEYDANVNGTAQPGYQFKDAVDEDMYSQEFDLISPDKGFLTWVTGVYYQANNYLFPLGRFNLGYPTGVFNEIINGTNLTNSAAAFGQFSLHFRHGVKFQLGARYSYNDSINRVGVVIPEFAYAEPDHQMERDYHTTGKASLSWAVNHANYLYAFVATGYKQGGINLPIGVQYQAPFRAEYITDYEIGWKASALDDHLRTQLDGYYDRYHNFQVTIGDPLLPVQQLEVNNPSPTTLYGVEASLQAVLGNLSLDANAAFERTSLGTFFATDYRVPGLAVCNPLTGPQSAVCINLSGHPQTYAPELTYNLSAQYLFHLPDDATLTTRANYSHVGSQWATLFDNAALGDFLGARNLVSAQVEYGRGPWTFTAYGTNLTNEQYVSAMISQLRFAGAPRQYGIRITRFF